jgi:hypothetical protein
MTDEFILSDGFILLHPLQEGDAGAIHGAVQESIP